MEKEKNSKIKLDIKTILIIILFIIIIALTIAFFVSNRTSKESSINAVDSEQSNINISKINDNSTKTNDTENTSNTENAENDTKINKITANEIPTINLNETVSKEEKFELTVKSFNFNSTINPPNTSGYYRYYDATEGHQYLEIVYDYKNLTGSDVRADKISSIKVKYNDKYEYSGFAVIEDSDGDFTYSNITSIPALSVGKMHYLIEVPEEVAKDTAPIVAKINCGTEKYQMNLR